MVFVAADLLLLYLCFLFAWVVWLVWLLVRVVVVLAVGLVFLFGYFAFDWLVGLGFVCVAVIVVWCCVALFDLFAFIMIGGLLLLLNCSHYECLYYLIVLLYCMHICPTGVVLCELWYILFGWFVLGVLVCLIYCFVVCLTQFVVVLSAWLFAGDLCCCFMVGCCRYVCFTVVMLFCYW